MGIQIIDRALDRVKGKVFKGRFTGCWINAEQAGEVFTLGRKNKLVSLNCYAIFVFDGKIVELLFSSFLVVSFNLVTEVPDVLTSCCDSYGRHLGRLYAVLIIRCHTWKGSPAPSTSLALTKKERGSGDGNVPNSKTKTKHPTRKRSTLNSKTKYGSRKRRRNTLLENEAPSTRK